MRRSVDQSGVKWVEVWLRADDERRCETGGAPAPVTMVVRPQLPQWRCETGGTPSHVTMAVRPQLPQWGWRGWEQLAWHQRRLHIPVVTVAPYLTDSCSLGTLGVSTLSWAGVVSDDWARVPLQSCVSSTCSLHRCVNSSSPLPSEWYLCTWLCN